ncbi:hypothetical protein GE061_007972 [Apolygus lucorum]|uniref:Peptidase S1 domain-containing protein n=1 Tax=Apolygus lucorum TaxID=248454 RepID=A0A8S9WS44_APOLU|nr:hypothetical protein GE061_007972 [Apolygus lucorum]
MNLMVFAFFGLWGAIDAQKEDNEGAFQAEYYAGLRQNGVVKIHYNKKFADWPRQPQHCYGALMDFKLAIVPCSCVAFTKDGLMASAWNQASHSNKVDHVPESSLMVGLMGDEYSKKEKTNRVEVDKIVLHSKCDATFQVDYAMVHLKKKLDGARLVWVNSANKDELKKQIDGVSITSAIYGSCLVMRWTHSMPSPDTKSMWIVEESPVNVQNWNSCFKLVCPDTTPDGKVYIPQRFDQCFNHNVTGLRKCLTTTHREELLCNYVPGSPVFCEEGQFRGIIGILTNFTTNCGASSGNNGVMASFVDAMSLAAPDLRIGVSLFYSNLQIAFNDEPKILYYQEDEDTS